MEYNIGALADANMNHGHIYNLMAAGRSKKHGYKITQQLLSTLKDERALAMSNAYFHDH